MPAYGSRRRRLALQLTTAAMLAVAGPVAAGSSPASARGSGGVRLTPCTTRPAGLCGSIRVPLDRTDARSPSIGVGFELIPATGRAAGTVLAVEGGPGYPSTGSRWQYLGMLGPRRADRDLLLVDLRGTGTSTPIRCAALQHYLGVASGPAFVALVGRCGDRLNSTWRREGGGFIHASDLFTTANAARDVRDVLAALHRSSVDLYGDSYGSYFAAAFASRYPRLLRSVTLDSTYETVGLDPWYRTTVTTARRAFRTVCQRSLGCRRATSPDQAWSRIGALAARLRIAPIDGTAPGLAGRPVRVTVDVRTLVDLVNDAGYDPDIYRQLDASVRAVLEHGDRTPLLRLAAQSIPFDNTYGPDSEAYSDGVYFAVACTDYPQLFDMRAPPPVRARRLAARLAALPAATFAPFTPAEWTSMDAYTEAYSACLDWPPSVHHDPVVTGRPPLIPSSLPALVLGGDLDSLTPAVGGEHVARQLGPSARFVLLPNMTHVAVMLDAHHCAATIWQHFIARPAGPLDTSCTREVAEIRAVGSFSRHLADVPAANALAGNGADAMSRRVASAAVLAAGDGLHRWYYLTGSRDTGLRGGSTVATGLSTVTVTLSGSGWTEDTSTTGTVTWRRWDGAVRADLVVRTSAGVFVGLHATWNALVPHALATLTGSAGVVRLVATMPAP